MSDLRYPARYQINTRGWLTELSKNWADWPRWMTFRTPIRRGTMGKRHRRISLAWQRPECRGDCNGTGRTLLVGLLLLAWLAATPAAPTSAATDGSASPTTSDVDTAPE